MRIIAGQFRGRRLESPKGQTTRPITDRAKQSLFDYLSPLIDAAVVYDCFCGTGSMGLECLSRGAESVTFFDADRHALAGLRMNIASLGVADKAKVIAGNIFKLLPTLPVGSTADLIFLDPPYRFLVEQPDHLQQLAKSLADRHAKSNTRLLFRHGDDASLQLPGWRSADERRYGPMVIEVLRPDEARPIVLEGTGGPAAQQTGPSGVD